MMEVIILMARKVLIAIKSENLRCPSDTSTSSPDIIQVDMAVMKLNWILISIF